jgi:hypothetical protein
MFHHMINHHIFSKWYIPHQHRPQSHPPFEGQCRPPWSRPAPPGLINVCNPFPLPPTTQGDGVGGLALGEGIKHEFVFVDNLGMTGNAFRLKNKNVRFFCRFSLAILRF